MRCSTLIRQLCLSLLFPACFAYSQTAAPDKPQPAPPTAFDVVSIRPYVSNGLPPKQTISPGYLFAPKERIGDLIAMAYQVSESRLEGAPPWLHSDLYIVVAKMDEASDDDRHPLTFRPSSPGSHENSAQQIFQQRLQALLADRFHLKVHMDKRDMPHFDLVVAKGGLKLPEADADSCNRDLPDRNANRGAFSIRCVPMSTLATIVSLFYEGGKVVVDKTGLTGSYNINLSASPGRGDNLDDPGPSIYEDLGGFGLKLQPDKGPVDVLVIDHIDKPSPN